MLQQPVVFRRGFGVAPQLGRAQHFTLFVQQHQAMLLAGYADAEDVLAVHPGLLQGAVGGFGEGVQPFLGVLFTPAVGAADQGVRGGAQAQHLAAGGVEDDGLGALGAAVDSEEQVLLGHDGVLSIIIGLKIRSMWELACLR